MISSEVQRTLVKSPPELWAELSDPTSLARHLGELGEIKITRIEPEKTVEWEAADTTGKVLLKPSGWGTKVTLSAARELAAPEPAVEAVPETPVQVEPEPAIEAAPDPEPVAVEPEPEAIPEEAEPRPGFFARLFRRRAKEQAVPESPVDELSIEPAAAAEPEQPVAEKAPPPENIPDIAAELQAAEEVTAVLTAALDRLGAAHHRPFSRA
jgi:hypothetical protein